VLVEDNTDVKKGQPLFEFDRTPNSTTRSTKLRVYERLAREDSTRTDQVTLRQDKVNEAQAAKAED